MQRLNHHENGFTLLEIMIAVAVIGLLALIATPSYLEQRDKAMVARVISDIKHIEHTVLNYMSEKDSFPSNLDDVGLGGLKDPWGSAYHYWPISGDKDQKVRKDRNLHPINTDFDLYSTGKDGATNYPLTASASQDDVIRANNGAYIGLVSNY
jgi:general secretion pathway protein G